MKTEKIQIGKGMRHLVPKELESKIIGAHPFLKEENDWSNRVRLGGLFFDLSRVEWIDLGALMQVVLMAEAAVRSSIAVDVALPLPVPRASERVWMLARTEFASRTEENVQRRARAKDFLKYLRFKECLTEIISPEGNNSISILEDYDPSDEYIDVINQNSDTFDVIEREIIGDEGDLLYKHFFPLTWLSPAEGMNPIALSGFLSSVLGETHRGLEAIDAQTISNVILHELIENVRDHAVKTSRALISAWARPENIPPKAANYLEGERSFIEWLSAKKTPLVELVIGDSGDGVPTRLNDSFFGNPATKNFATHISSDDARIMLWSFDRWSTSKKSDLGRGTRGLYRVDRIVKKYQGLITLRSSNQMVGIDHGGPSYDHEFAEMGKLSCIPGTVLRVRIPPFREKQNWRNESPVINPKVIYELIPLGSIDTYGIKQEILLTIKKALEIPGRMLCLVTIAESGFDVEKQVEQTLKQLVEIRHPGAIVLYGAFSNWDLMENAVESVNEEHKLHNRDQEWSNDPHKQVWDPLLIYGGPGKILWAGANDELRDVLNNLFSNPDIITEAKLSELVPNKKIRASVLRHLRNDSHLVSFNDDGTLVKRFDLISVEDELCKHVVQTIQSYIHNSGIIGKPGVLSGKVFRTPSLQYVDKWLNISTILDNTCGSFLATLALAIKVRRFLFDASIDPHAITMVDFTSNSSTTSNFIKNLGVHHLKEIPGENDIPNPTNVHVLDSDTKVIIHTDLIAAGEAARIGLRQIIQDSAVPILLTCILDARESQDNHFDVRGIQTRVISLIQMNFITDRTDSATAINPITGREEDPFIEPNEHRKDKLIKIIAQKEALFFSHIERRIGRHFTFYLDAKRIVNDEGVCSWIDNEINNWLPKDESKFEIWFPEYETDSSAAATHLARNVAAHRMGFDNKYLKSVRRRPAHGNWYFYVGNQEQVTFSNVLVVDWGAMTGNTITQMIRHAAESGAKRILVCVLISQMSSDEEAFLNSLTTISVSRKIRMVGNLFEQQIRNVLPEDPIEVSVKFLSRFPIKAFEGSNECPICSNRLRMFQEIYPTQLLNDFAREQEYSRLQPRKRKDVIKDNPRDLNDRYLTSESVLAMHTLRQKLEHALGSTLYRYLILEYLEGLDKSLVDSHPKVSQEILDILHLLSVETQWLRNPPLHYDIPRKLLGNLSLSVALNENLDEKDRSNAITVLRISARSLFASKFKDLFISSISKPSLTKQLLYGSFTYLTRPYQQSDAVLEPMRHALILVSQSIQNKEHGLIPEPIADTVELLKNRSITESEKAKFVGWSTPKIWAQLRNRLSAAKYAQHDPPAEDALKMLPGPNTEYVECFIQSVENNVPDIVNKEKVLRYTTILNEKWKICSDFLDRTLFPHLCWLHDILRSKDSIDILGSEIADPLINMVDDLRLRKKTVSESIFSQRVRHIHSNPDVFLTRSTWEQVKQEIDWYWQAIFRPSVESSNDSKLNQLPSRLIELVRSCPTSISMVVNEVIERVGTEISPIQIKLEEQSANDILVFVPERLLIDTVEHLIRNVKKHLDPDNFGIPSISIEIKPIESLIVMSIRNTGTKIKEPPGKGLNDLDIRLKPFGAKIYRQPRPNEPNITFEVHVTFEQGV